MIPFSMMTEIPFAPDDELARRLREVEVDLRTLADRELDGLLAVRVGLIVEKLEKVASILEPGSDR